MASFEENQKIKILASYNTDVVAGELIKSEIVNIEKGSRRAVIGEKRTFGGREYIKTSDGWKFHGKGTGAKAQGYAAETSSVKKPTDKDNTSFEVGEQSDRGSREKESRMNSIKREAAEYQSGEYIDRIGGKVSFKMKDGQENSEEPMFFATHQDYNLRTGEPKEKVTTTMGFSEIKYGIKKGKWRKSEENQDAKLTSIKAGDLIKLRDDVNNSYLSDLKGKELKVRSVQPVGNHRYFTVEANGEVVDISEKYIVRSNR